MNTKTLIVLLGSARGGEETWKSMYKYLLEPLSADLAIIRNIFQIVYTIFINTTKLKALVEGQGNLEDLELLYLL